MAREVPREAVERLALLGLRLGCPVQIGGGGIIYVPEKPHVFFCSDLYLIMPEEERKQTGYQLNLAEVTTGGDNPKVRQAVHLRRMMVMLGHGEVNGAEDYHWVFRGTSLPVQDTVKTYMELAKLNGWLTLDAIVACREIAAFSPPIIRTGVEKAPNTFPRMLVPPYVYSATKHFRVIFPDQPTSTLLPGRGASLVVETSKVMGLKWWIEYRKLQPPPEVPSWAVQPAYSSSQPREFSLA